MPQEKRYILCFDFLKNPQTEAIDSYSFFQYLQKKGIPSKYALLRQNDLYKKLQAENNLKDILPVNSELQLLSDYPDIIAQSKFILCSFAFSISTIFRQLPFAKYIFIEHGVVLLKEWCTANYTDEQFDGKLVPTSLTKNLYEKMGYGSPSCVKYYCGLPRWDNLKMNEKNKETRKIFIFFTFRESFRNGVKYRRDYVNRVQTFVNRLSKELVGTNVTLYLALHHYLYMLDPKGWEQMQNVNHIPTTRVSEMVREADMCITDFSSIGFDFLYRNVPVIYYCFDADIVYPNKNDDIKRIADSIDHHLYNCCRAENSAVSRILDYVARDFALEPEFVERNESIFWQRGGNCEKLLQLISD